MLIESADRAIFVEGNWTLQDTPSASGGSYLYSSGNSSDVISLIFSGSLLEIVYVKHSAFGTLAIEVDGVLIRTLSTTSTTPEFGLRTVIDYLEPTNHEVRLYSSEGVIAIDAFFTDLPGDLQPLGPASSFIETTPSPVGTLATTLPYDGYSLVQTAQEFNQALSGGHGRSIGDLPYAIFLLDDLTLPSTQTIQGHTVIYGDNHVLQGGDNFPLLRVGDASYLKIHHTVFRGGTHSLNGAYGGQGGILLNWSGHVEIYDSIFESNSAYYGGAIFSNSSLDIYRSTFHQNSATASGGAVFSKGGTRINCTTFSQNQAQWAGAFQHTRLASSLVIITNNALNANVASVEFPDIRNSTPYYVIDATRNFWGTLGPRVSSGVNTLYPLAGDPTLTPECASPPREPIPTLVPQNDVLFPRVNPQVGFCKLIIKPDNSIRFFRTPIQAFLDAVNPQPMILEVPYTDNDTNEKNQVIPLMYWGKRGGEVLFVKTLFDQSQGGETFGWVRAAGRMDWFLNSVRVTDAEVIENCEEGVQEIFGDGLRLGESPGREGDFENADEVLADPQVDLDARLLEYGLYTVTSSPQGVPEDFKRELYRGVVWTANALTLFSHRFPSDPYTNAKSIFRNILLEDNTPATLPASTPDDLLLVVLFEPSRSVDCQTYNYRVKPAALVGELELSDGAKALVENGDFGSRTHRAYIWCHPNMLFTQYTLVHELGHVFNNSADQRDQTSLTEYVTFTASDESYEILDNQTRIVMGRVNGINAEDAYDNWVRGPRGWGSGPSCVYIYSPNIKCTRKLFTDFQQNGPPYGPTENRYDETGADLFLNWVYSIMADQTGFRNLSWRPFEDNDLGKQQGECDTTEGCPDEDRRPGDARFEWTGSPFLIQTTERQVGNEMYQITIMRRIFNAKNW